MQNFMTDNLITVIDLGTSEICGVIGRKDNNGCVEILASESVPSKGIRRGAIYNLGDAAFCINNVLTLLKNKINILFNRERSDEEKITYEISGVYVGLNGHIKTVDSRVSRNLGKAEVTREIIDTLCKESRNIKIGDREVLEVVDQEYLVDDFNEINPVGCICTRIEGCYKVIAGHPDLKSYLYECFERVGCKIHGVVLSPVATASATLSEEEKELGCAMIDFGAGTTSVVVYYKNILRHVGVIPFGGDTITKDIQDLKISELAAEKLKVKYGSAMEELAEDFNISIPAAGGKEGKTVDNKFLAGIIEARTEEILDYISGQIEKSGFADRVNGIVITGGGSQLLNLTEKIELRTGLDVRIGIPDQKAAPAMDTKYLHVEYAQLTGLLIQAKKSCITENGEGVKKKKIKTQGKGIFGTLFDKFEEIFTEDSKI